MFYCDKNTLNGVGDRFLHKSGHGLTLGHVYDMRCLGKHMDQHRNVEKNR